MKITIEKEEISMRYFDFVIMTNAEQIKEKAKINLREYDFQNPVAAMNGYMYKNMKNGVCYFAYREEEEVTLAAFSYDERRWKFRDAYDYILEMLNEIFSVRKVKAEPSEVTMYRFYEYLLEARFCKVSIGESVSQFSGVRAGSQNPVKGFPALGISGGRFAVETIIIIHGSLPSLFGKGGGFFCVKVVVDMFQLILIFLKEGGRSVALPV